MLLFLRVICAARSIRRGRYNARDSAFAPRSILQHRLQYLLEHQFTPPRAKLVTFLNSAPISVSVGDAICICACSTEEVIGEPGAIDNGSTTYAASSLYATLNFKRGFC
jgi:hypothetical protein